MAYTWKDIPGYSGQYQASKCGKIRSVERVIMRSNGKPQFIKERVLSETANSGYLTVSMPDGKKYVHHLVASAFMNHIVSGHKMVLDHINKDKFDNRVENLRIVTNRENCLRVNRGYSNLPGAFWRKNRGQWFSRIKVNGKYKHLGSFQTDIEAHNRYKEELKKIGECILT